MKKVKNYIPLLVVILIMFAFCLRLFEWQFVDGKKYQNVSDTSSSYTLKMASARGEILDRNGESIAASRMTYNVVMDALEIAEDRNPALYKTLNLMVKNNIEWIDRLPIEFVKGEYKFKKNTESEQNYLKTEMLTLESTATADLCMQKLVEKYGCEKYGKEEALQIVSVRYGMTRVDFSVSEPYIIAQDVPIEFVEIIKESSKDLQGVKIQVSSQRDYGDGTLAPHIIGTMGLMSSEQYEEFLENDDIFSYDNLDGYSYNDTVGKSGIELAFEDLLHGSSGSTKITPETKTTPMSQEILSEPIAGENVYLTLDVNLQEMLNYSLAKNVGLSEQSDCYAGAAVVLDVETFGVLASSTYPTYDLNKYEADSNYYNQLLEEEEKPLFNRAFTGAFTPGSIMKPAVAIASLEEGIITENTTVECNGVYDYYESSPLKCIGSHAPGDVDVYTGICTSCNSFFCDAGRRLGIDAMEVYANLFGLGVPTGIEVYETTGTMTNPAEYEYNHGTSWVDGVTIQAAIGQADSMFTPLQLATYCATIANNGTRLQTHLFHQSTNFENTEITDTYKPVTAETIEVNQRNIEIVQQAMRQAVTDGTASNPFASYGISVAAKTGTAQNAGHSDSTTFIAYAPYDDPEIAIAVVIEYGASGLLSKDVAKDVFDCYFFGKTVQEKIAEDLQ